MAGTIYIYCTDGTVKILKLAGTIYIYCTDGTVKILKLAGTIYILYRWNGKDIKVGWNCGTRR